jgi:mRNA-degrading endonuclease YafQ of YafQ-DinJ toxin-antitoxin module
MLQALKNQWHKLTLRSGKYLTSEDYEQVAAQFNYDVATVQAIAYVYGTMSGRRLLLNGLPKILFDAQHFSFLTSRNYDQSHPHISQRSWNKPLYYEGIRAWHRLKEAERLNRQAAYRSTAWGLGRIRGNCYKECGYLTVDDFVAAMQLSERKQLEAMLELIRHLGLDEALRSHDWKTFDQAYNGILYRECHYAEKLAVVYQQFLVKKSTCALIQHYQNWLLWLRIGLNTGYPDWH